VNKRLRKSPFSHFLGQLPFVVVDLIPNIETDPEISPSLHYIQQIRNPMKSIFTILIAALVLGTLSCKQEGDSPEGVVNGPWELVKITGGFSGDVIEGENLTYTEKYQFNSDGSFSKTTSRIVTGTGLPLQALGKFTIVPNTEPDQLMNLRLVFETNPDAAATCGPSIEEVFINTDYQLINNKWAPCDGPILYYERSTSR
jgi:hypothetical protein